MPTSRAPRRLSGAALLDRVSRAVGCGWPAAGCELCRMDGDLAVVFLRDVEHGGPDQQLPAVAERLAAFVDAAQTSLDVAIYDFRLADPAATATVVGALVGAAGRGVTVRIGYDAGKPAAATAAEFALLEA